MKTKTKTLCGAWNPYQTFIWTRQQIESWYDTYGSSCLYDGVAWEPEAKKLIGNRYNVKFVRAK